MKNTIVIVYDRSMGERNRWENGPVPREGEYVRDRHGEKLLYPVLSVSYETEDGTSSLFVSVIINEGKGRHHKPIGPATSR